MAFSVKACHPKKALAHPIELSTKQSQDWMAVLLKRAHHLGLTGEIPVTAVVLDHYGRCIGHGSNNRELTQNPLGHAELIALRQASWIREDWRFNDCTLIVTLEPCPMCAGALVQARMGQVIFGTSDPKRGGLGSTIDLAKHKSAHHHMVVIGGVMEDQAKTQLQSWFKRQRKHPREN